MKFFDPNNPNEKKKMIAAGVLGLVAILILGYVFLGGSSSKPPSNRVTTGPSPAPPRGPITTQPPDPPSDEISNLRPVVFTGTVASVTEGDRNIFAYYEPPPPPTPRPVIVQTPTPTPTPPLMANGVTPSNVYARTPGDFSLQISGDKFTPAVHIIFDGRDLPTRFINAQQLFATVPASLILFPGPKSVMARTPDGKLYSNQLSLNVAPPPDPNQSFTYVGLIGKRSFNDTAVLQNRSSKELMNVQRGEVIGNRFRIMSITDKEIQLIDTQLKIPHKLAFSSETSPNSPYRPPTRVDDEP
jgi:hypothetical protein